MAKYTSVVECKIFEYFFPEKTFIGYKLIPIL